MPGRRRGHGRCDRAVASASSSGSPPHAPSFGDISARAEEFQVRMDMMATIRDLFGGLSFDDRCKCQA